MSDERLQEFARDNPEGCAEAHSPNGLCPCCGAELEEEIDEKWTGDYDEIFYIEHRFHCSSCGWESEPSYDG